MVCALFLYCQVPTSQSTAFNESQEAAFDKNGMKYKMSNTVGFMM
jgi:hypothetical protein